MSSPTVNFGSIEVTKSIYRRAGYFIKEEEGEPVPVSEKELEGAIEKALKSLIKLKG